MDIRATRERGGQLESKEREVWLDTRGTKVTLEFKVHWERKERWGNKD